MKKNVLFLSDSSLLNPIVHSQGLPLLKFLSEKNYMCFFLHFESSKLNDQENNRLFDVQTLYSSSITFKQITVKTYYFIPGILFNGIRIMVRIILLSIKFKFDIYHARSFFPAVFCLIIKKIFPKVKFIYDNRGLFIDEEILKGRWKENGLLVKILRKIENKLIKNADHIVVVSNKFCELLFNNYNHCCSHLEQKVTVIGNRTLIPKELHLEEIVKRKKRNKVVGVFAGSAAEWQNVKEIFSFAKICYKNIPNFTLKIVSYHLDIFKKTFQAEAGIYEKTQFIQVNTSKVSDHLITSDFGILLRDNILINNVASPLKFAEYLCAGLSVVVSEGVGDTEEIIRKYNVGVIVRGTNYENAVTKLITLLNDEDIHIRSIKAAKKEYNIVDSFHLYEKIYQDMLPIS